MQQFTLLCVIPVDLKIEAKAGCVIEQSKGRGVSNMSDPDNMKEDSSVATCPHTNL